VNRYIGFEFKVSDFDVLFIPVNNTHHAHLEKKAKRSLYLKAGDTRVYGPTSKMFGFMLPNGCEILSTFRVN
jgi:hypothetical protein